MGITIIALFSSIKTYIQRNFQVYISKLCAQAPETLKFDWFFFSYFLKKMY